MKLEFAPMEGITNHIFRRIHNELFPGADRYYTPFIAPDAAGSFKTSYLKGLMPDIGGTTCLVPQILTNNANAFLIVSRKLADLGFSEVNLNCGCPSGTVVSKHKGSGMLGSPDELDRFLDFIFSSSPLRISVKTRLGLYSTDEFPRLLNIYNKYPISLLTIHARDRKGMYKSLPDLSSYILAETSSKNPLSYNGNIFSAADMNNLLPLLNSTQFYMIGRGAVANPALFRIIKGGNPLTRDELTLYHDRLIDESIADGLAPNFAVMRMKELWSYMIHMFPDSRKAFKAMNKSVSLPDFLDASHTILRSCQFDPCAGYSDRCSSNI